MFTYCRDLNNGVASVRGGTTDIYASFFDPLMPSSCHKGFFEASSSRSIKMKSEEFMLVQRKMNIDIKVTILARKSVKVEGN